MYCLKNIILYLSVVCILYWKAVHSQEKHCKYCYQKDDVNCSKCSLDDENLSRFTFRNKTERIDLSFNSLFKVTPAIFRGLHLLTTLNISSNYLINVERGSFADLYSLRILDISHNTYLGIDNFVNITFDLYYTDIKEIYANYINSIGMPGIILSKEQTQMLQNTSLKILSLDANQIQHVELDSVMTLPKSLVNLSVQANEFGRSAFLTLSAIFQLPNLEQIDFSYQCSNYQAFEFGRRQKRFIEDNKSGPRPERLEDLCYSSFKVKNFALSPSLRSVISKETEITKCIPAIEFQENSVERVYLSKSSLYAWKGPITMKGTPNLTVVDLSDNNCRKVSRNFFDYGFTIEILLLAGNNLGLTFALTQNNRIFQNLTRLRILDVSRNNIEELDAAFLKDQIMLEHLSFSKNYLKSFTLSIEHMNKLKHLDLSHNRIIVVSNVLISKQDFGNAFSVLQQNGTLDIRANPLECTCRGILFWQWAQETKIRILYNINLTCMLDNGQDIVVTNLLRNLKQIDGSCKSKLLLIILMVVLILTILSFCVAFIYRYRWEIRYRWFLFKLKRKGYERIAETEDDFKYDVFLSYADEDGSYVHRNIMPYLESENKLRVCLHERDFTPGESITSNILRAVHGSQRTLAIVSPKYIESHWCLFEFRMASVEQAFGNRKVIVVALLQNLTVSNIPPEVMHYLRTNSYIELPKEGIDTDDQHAWSALLTSITT